MQSAIKDADCLDFINENPARVRCGFIDLPRDHNNPARGAVTLPILIAEQTRSMAADPSDKAILIPGGGGPGAPIGFGLPYRQDEYLGIYNSLRAAGFDLIILDQRGAGLAKPILRCPETASAFKATVEKEVSLSDSLSSYRTSLNECRSRLLQQDISLSDFDTYQSANDFLSTMDSLPYQWWGVLATSYATVIAQEMEKIKPGVFELMVLDSPVAIDYQAPFTFELTESALLRILSLCEITRRCNAKYSNIKSKFKTILERAEQQPYSLAFKVSEHNSTRQIDLPVNNTTLLDMLILAAYSNYSIAEIPWIIDGLYKDKVHRIKNLAKDYWHYNSDLDYATALSWSIHCKERQPLEQSYLQAHPQEIAGYSENSKIAMQQEALICKDWNTQPIIPETNKQVFTTGTFIVAGDLDPVISRADIKYTADDFSNKTIKILPGTGHSVWYQSECTRRNVVAFFTEGLATTLQDCTDGINRFK